MMKKVWTGLAVGLAATIGLTGSAFAHECVNLSRKPAEEPFTERGNWLAVPTDEFREIWVKTEPKTIAAVEGAACNAARLAGQTKGTGDVSELNGIWSIDCIITAFVR